MNNFWHDLPRPFFVLAPMEAVTDVVFRHVVKAAGSPDLFFTEFTNATGWVHAGDKAIGGRLIKTEDETNLVAHLWGSVPEDMGKLAARARELGFIGIDINMGCPDKSATKGGAGAALCRTPELAGQMIAAAKTAGLPVSVKCRLGYSRIDEWRDWLSYLLQQDISNLSVHLRTKKEMSKVPAHYELIPEIIKLRDEIAPDTRLTINGDIEDREHGLRLASDNPGIDGIMIGRGVFHNPFCFEASQTGSSASARVARGGAAPTSSEQREVGAGRATGPESSDLRDNSVGISDDGSGHDQADSHRQKLLDLLRLQLDLYDQYADQTGRPYDTLKRFFKIYVRDFEGAAELRDKLMHTKSTDDVRALLP